MTIELKITGIDALKAKFDGLSQDLRYKSGRFALRKAANLIANRAKENAMRLDDPETGRSIAGNVAVRWGSRAFKRTGDLVFRVGIMGGARIPKTNRDPGAGGPTPHWRLLEFGTQNMPAQPIMRPAAEQSAQEAIDTFARELDKAIDRNVKRAAKK